MLKERGFTVKEIIKRLEEQHVFISRSAIFKLLKKYRRYGTVGDLRRSRLPKKLSEDQLVFIDDSLAENDELTARKLRYLLQERWPETVVSISTIKRARKGLGWVATRPKYCQLIREVNKIKRVNWCEERIKDNEKFEDVIFTDECTVELDNHGRICFRKIKQPRKLKPRAKHPIKVHVWAGISQRGATPIVIFSGIMTSIRYCNQILNQGLIPFLDDVFPDHYRFQQDNDPKHSSYYTRDFLAENGINWWPTPPESPDLNPIENVWASMKYYLRNDYKPRDLQSLMDGILAFWRSMTPDVCKQYIKHLHKVMPKVIQVNGAASGY